MSKENSAVSSFTLTGLTFVGLKDKENAPVESIDSLEVPVTCIAKFYPLRYMPTKQPRRAYLGVNVYDIIVEDVFEVLKEQGYITEGASLAEGVSAKGTVEIEIYMPEHGETVEATTKPIAMYNSSWSEGLNLYDPTIAAGMDVQTDKVIAVCDYSKLAKATNTRVITNVIYLSIQ